MLNLESEFQQINIEAPERNYSGSCSAEHKKRFGQFFTPRTIAALMADWVTARGAKKILDPSFGTGVLAQACLDIRSNLNITCYEIDPCVTSFVPTHLLNRVNLIKADFLAAQTMNKFDGVIMNPPYIRHREINGYETARIEISSQSMCSIPKSANLYIYFTIKAMMALRANGRGAFLIPSEWMSANFSKTFKNYMLSNGFIEHIIYFSNCSSIFADALTTASLLLVERGKSL